MKKGVEWEEEIRKSKSVSNRTQKRSLFSGLTESTPASAKVDSLSFEGD